jgi:hypothetical protein
MNYRLPAVLVCLFIALNAQAVIITWNFGLDGFQEVPPVVTPGTGTVSAQLDTETLQVQLTGSYQDLLVASTAAHVHGPASSSENAGVFIPLAHSADTSGSLSGAQVLTSEQAGWLLSGLAYVNVHTSRNPGGEIRGQFTPKSVPDAGHSALLLLGALGSLVAVRRWKAAAV